MGSRMVCKECISIFAALAPPKDKTAIRNCISASRTSRSCLSNWSLLLLLYCLLCRSCRLFRNGTTSRCWSGISCCCFSWCSRCSSSSRWRAFLFFFENVVCHIVCSWCCNDERLRTETSLYGSPLLIMLRL